MKTISLQEIIEQVINENPSKSKSSKNNHLLKEQYDLELDEYLDAIKLYKKAIKKNPKVKIDKPKKPIEPDNSSNGNLKRIEGMRDKFKRILESFDVESDVFKVSNKYIFPKKSLTYVKQILLFDLNKTPVYSLKKDGDKEPHFNQEQLEQIAKLRKVINTLIGYQQRNPEGLATAMQVTRKLKINDKKAERYIGELLKEKYQVAKKVSNIFDEKMYPSLTIEERVDVFHQMYLEIETFVETLDEKINEAIEQIKETN